MNVGLLRATNTNQDCSIMQHLFFIWMRIHLKFWTILGQSALYSRKLVILYKTNQKGYHTVLITLEIMLSPLSSAGLKLGGFSLFFLLFALLFPNTGFMGWREKLKLWHLIPRKKGHSTDKRFVYNCLQTIIPSQTF